MKNMIRNSVIVLASVFAINAAQAESDGGLMAEMMAKKFPAQVITDPAAQARLAQVTIPDGSGNGGLRVEMLQQHQELKAANTQRAAEIDARG